MLWRNLIASTPGWQAQQSVVFRASLSTVSWTVRAGGLAVPSFMAAPLGGRLDGIDSMDGVAGDGDPGTVLAACWLEALTDSTSVRMAALMRPGGRGQVSWTIASPSSVR
jgi:hypothetical protein